MTAAPFLAGIFGSGPKITIPADGPIVIQDDPGGNVHAYLRFRDKLERLGRPVILKGHIASAAVVFATLPTACLRPGVLLRFHGAKGGWPGLAERRIAEVLRNEMRRMWWDVWRHSRDWSDVTAEEAIRLDPLIRLCKRP